MEMSSKAYKAWNYPYAVDGLDMWAAIKNWVADYCAIYYPNDGAMVVERGQERGAR